MIKVTEVKGGDGRTYIRYVDSDGRAKVVLKQPVIKSGGDGVVQQPLPLIYRAHAITSAVAARELDRRINARVSHVRWSRKPKVKKADPARAAELMKRYGIGVMVTPDAVADVLTWRD